MEHGNAELVSDCVLIGSGKETGEMLTLEEFDSLETGDHIETVPLFAGLSEEPVVLQTGAISEGGNRKAFTVTYFGVTLAEWSCVKTEGVLAWEI